MFKKIKKFNNKKKGIVTDEAIVLENLSHDIYRVKLKNSNNPITGYLCGNMVRNNIRLIKGDTVIVELSILDSKKCRIVFRK